MPTWQPTAPSGSGTACKSVIITKVCSAFICSLNLLVLDSAAQALTFKGGTWRRRQGSKER